MAKGGIRPRSADGSLEHLLKSKWKLGKTRTIRVPIVLADQLLEIAYCLDKGNVVDLSRDKNDILLGAIRAFIAAKEREYGANNAQKGKQFSMNTRGWDYFKEFAELAEKSVEKLL